MGGIFKRLALGGNLRWTLIRAGALVVLTVLIFRFVFAPLRLDGTSMEPTFQHGQLSLANRLAYLRDSPQRGDVVAVRMRNTGRSIFLLKRVVGLPGEAVGFEGGKVTVDGVRLEEDYLTYDSDWNRDPVLCEANEYFVVGDNRSMPIRQHTFGRTTLARIVGKVIF
ncbi:signal peptidase I [Coraliomargarita sinensis]|uniref:Signal peptidase I n=1 Tax=Coraliomargarita sinensis TaxID=2174842 RepID=A0A317ZHB8_9BACT|nr:signal peptidase I [Coraliomargarita sinensis]PXA05074.1 signal peptidase I [Coraliomargarita sinensis]